MRRFLIRLPLIGALFASDKHFVSATGGLLNDAIAAYSQAKGIVRKIIGNARDADVQVIGRAGQRKIKGNWAWQDSQWGNKWIAGMYSPGSNAKAEIGVHPVTGKEWNFGTLLHELVHHFLYRIGIRNHDTRFDGLVPGWASTRAAGLPRVVAAGFFFARRKRPPFRREVRRYGPGDDDIIIADIIEE